MTSKELFDALSGLQRQSRRLRNELQSLAFEMNGGEEELCKSTSSVFESFVAFVRKLRAKASAFEKAAIVSTLEAYVEPALPFFGMEQAEFEFLNVVIQGIDYKLNLWSCFSKMNGRYSHSYHNSST